MSRVAADALAPERTPHGGAPSTQTPSTPTDGRARRWDTHRIARRAELTHDARRAIHHGGAELSMDEIAAAIGTSKSIVYRYFSDRAGLQRAVGEAVLHDLGAALAEASRGAAAPEQALRAMVAVYLEMVAASPSVYVFVMRGTGPGEASGTPDDPAAPMHVLAQDAALLLVPVLEDVLRGSGRPPALAPVWAAGVIGFVRGAADLWLTQQVTGTAATSDLTALADTIADWLCHGMAAAPTHPDVPRPTP